MNEPTWSELKSSSKELLLRAYDTRETEGILRILWEDLSLSKAPMPSRHDLNLWQSAIERIVRGEPVAYVTGMSQFLDLRLFVNNSVLIPRPETEELVIKCLEYIDMPRPNILDIGTGSGCISLALKSRGPQSRVTAIDINPQALEIAKKNAAHFQLAIHFQLLDFLDLSAWASLPEDLDLIVSNPPYIAMDEKKFMARQTLDFEPPEALFAPLDPLIFYHKIADFSRAHLKSGGWICLEINEFRGEETLKIFQQTTFENCRIIKDLAGKNRILVACKK
jgi:release factor glutamine methyltransferase